MMSTILYYISCCIIYIYVPWNGLERAGLHPWQYPPIPPIVWSNFHKFIVLYSCPSLSICSIMLLISLISLSLNTVFNFYVCSNIFMILPILYIYYNMIFDMWKKIIINKYKTQATYYSGLGFIIYLFLFLLFYLQNIYHVKQTISFLYIPLNFLRVFLSLKYLNDLLVHLVLRNLFV